MTAYDDPIAVCWERVIPLLVKDDEHWIYPADAPQQIRMGRDRRLIASIVFQACHGRPAKHLLHICRRDGCVAPEHLVDTSEDCLLPCPSCGIEIDRRALRTHVDGRYCRVYATRRDMRARGFVAAPDGSAWLAKKAGVEVCAAPTKIVSGNGSTPPSILDETWMPELAFRISTAPASLEARFSALQRFARESLQQAEAAS